MGIPCSDPKYPIFPKSAHFINDIKNIFIEIIQLLSIRFMKTRLTRLLSIQYPIIQAPIGSATTPRLAAAVSNAGGMGMLACSWQAPDKMRESIRTTKKLTDKTFGVNLVLAWDQSERIQICLEEQVPVVSFFWGDPIAYIPSLKEKGIKICQTIGSSEEAVQFEKAGMDFVVAQGWESGGHVWGKVASSALIPAIADKISIPFAAAGGFSDGRGLLAALSLGASGVWMGSRFLMTKEANVHPIYQSNIAKATESDTVYTNDLFNIGWANAPHRIIRNSTVTSWEKAGCPLPGNRPEENEIVAHKISGESIQSYADTIPTMDTLGRPEALALYAGQSIGIIDEEVKSAQEIVYEIMIKAKSALINVNAIMNTIK